MPAVRRLAKLRVVSRDTRQRVLTPATAPLVLAFWRRLAKAGVLTLECCDRVVSKVYPVQLSLHEVSSGETSRCAMEQGGDAYSNGVNGYPVSPENGRHSPITAPATPAQQQVSHEINAYSDIACGKLTALS